MRPSRQPVRASRLGRDQLWSSVESVDRCLDQSRARLCRSRVRLLHYSSESSKRVAAQEPSSTQGSKSKQNRREKCARGMIAGRSCILSARSRICATRPDVTWRLRPHNIVLVPAAGELASYHRCHVRASRGPLGETRVWAGRRARVRPLASAAPPPKPAVRPASREGRSQLRVASPQVLVSTPSDGRIAS